MYQLLMIVNDVIVFRFVIKVLNNRFPNEYKLMIPDNKVSPYIAKTYGMDECENYIENYTKYAKFLKENNKCMVLKKYRYDAGLFFKDFIEPIKKEKNDENLVSNFIGRFLFQMLKALAFLDSHGVIHNDVKLENIFITDDYDVVLGDLGFAVKKPNDNSANGTFVYFSPERAQAIFRTYISKENHLYTRKFRYLATTHTSKADVYAVGVSAHVFCFNYVPYDVNGEPEQSYPLRIVKRIMEGGVLKELKTINKHICNKLTFDSWVTEGEKKERKKVSFNGVELLMDLLQDDPEKRPTAKDALRKYFKYDYNIQKEEKNLEY
eukprot:GHVR01068603.1.p1 GENE.GHVR01068603.1~~GHVR01068603.1.p1  ORF type:complete len:322 (+),score=50.14 GHVR01068603.1:304-1269(+)